ncbi:MAG: hypothetical protein ACREAM_30350 [Blastocatellia bacterium]
MNSAIRSIVFCLSIGVQTLAQGGNAASAQRPEDVRLVMTTRTSTFEKELNQAAGEGFRLTCLARAVYAGTVAAILSRNHNPAGNPAGSGPQVRYEYKALATSRLATMRTELEQAVAEGYEYRGMTSENSSLPFSRKETIAVLERPAGETKRRFEYKLVTARKEQEDLDAAAAAGFVPVDVFVTDRSAVESMFSFSASNLRLNFIFSREAGQSGSQTPVSQYRLIWRADNVKMQTELNELAREGFQLKLVAVYPVALMSRPGQGRTQQYEYTVLADMRKKPLPVQMTEAGARGYQFRGASYGLTMTAVMERAMGGSAGSGEVEYKILGTIRESTTRREMDEALASGFTVRDFLSLNENLLVLGKKAAPNSRAR